MPVVSSLLREEIRLHGLEKGIWRARIPVAHRAEVLRVHQPAFARIRKHLLPQFPAILQRPEEGAVVVPAVEPLRLRRRLGRVWIRADVGERLLEEVVLADAEHERVETVLHAPVDLALPVLKAPVLRLEARKPAMREVADCTVFEARLLADVNA